MNRIHHVVFLPLALVWLGVACANFSKARLTNISQVREGQTPEEVRETLDRPKKEFLWDQRE